MVLIQSFFDYKYHALFRNEDPPESIIVLKDGESAIIDCVIVGEKYKTLWRGYVYSLMYKFIYM